LATFFFFVSDAAIDASTGHPGLQQ